MWLMRFSRGRPGSRLEKHLGAEEPARDGLTGTAAHGQAEVRAVAVQAEDDRLAVPAQPYDQVIGADLVKPFADVGQHDLVRRRLDGLISSVGSGPASAQVGSGDSMRSVRAAARTNFSCSFGSV
jgi:hypothetical protein